MISTRMSHRNNTMILAYIPPKTNQKNRLKNEWYIKFTKKEEVTCSSFIKKTNQPSGSSSTPCFREQKHPDGNQVQGACVWHHLYSLLEINFVDPNVSRLTHEGAGGERRQMVMMGALVGGDGLSVDGQNSRKLKCKWLTRDLKDIYPPWN